MNVQLKVELLDSAIHTVHNNVYHTKNCTQAKPQRYQPEAVHTKSYF